MADPISYRYMVSNRYLVVVRRTVRIPSYLMQDGRIDVLSPLSSSGVRSKVSHTCPKWRDKNANYCTRSMTRLATDVLRVRAARTPT
jgi:hypothetical protein